MTSLVMYITAFMVVIGIIGAITTFFNNNVNEKLPSGTSSEYNKFNLYMLDETKRENNDIVECENGVVSFTNGDRFICQSNILYFNKIKLCENVTQFTVSKETGGNGKEILKTILEIGEIEYTTQYVID